jgi:stage II sporulation protein B
VDKLPSGKTITIKINGEKKPFIEENEKKELPNENSEKVADTALSDFPHPKQESYHESAASQEPLEESFDWILPETTENEINEYQFAKQTTNKKKTSKGKSTTASISAIRKKNGVLKSFIFSIVFAVLIGTSFGVIMLKLVVIDHSKKTTIETSAPVTKTVSKTATPKTSTEKITVQPFTAFFVQGGMFSTKEGANEISNQVKAKGVPAEIIEMDGKSFIFLGVSSTLEQAKSLGNYYKENGINEFYAKQIQVPEKTIADVNKDEKIFFEASQLGFQTLLNVTSNAIVNTSNTKEDISTISQTESALEKIEDKQIKNKKIIELKSELSSAMELVEGYQKSHDINDMKKAQQHLLNYFSLYSTL